MIRRRFFQSILGLLGLGAAAPVVIKAEVAPIPTKYLAFNPDHFYVGSTTFGPWVDGGGKVWERMWIVTKQYESKGGRLLGEEYVLADPAVYGPIATPHPIGACQPDPSDPAHTQAAQI